jgi:hypothetical protein
MFNFQDADPGCITSTAPMAQPTSIHCPSWASKHVRRSHRLHVKDALYPTASQLPFPVLPAALAKDFASRNAGVDEYRRQDVGSIDPVVIYLQVVWRKSMQKR